MRILHGSWLLYNITASPGAFVIWAEAGEVAARRSRVRGGARPHPFAATCKTLRTALLDLLPVAEVLMRSTTKDGRAIVQLPSTADRPQPSSPLLFEEPLKRDKLQIKPWKVEALHFAPRDALHVLANLPSEEDTTPGLKVGDDLRFWQQVSRLALEILAQQRFVPVLREQGVNYLALWQPQWSTADLQRIDRLKQAMPPICRAVGRGVADHGDQSGVAGPRALIDNFLVSTIDAFARAQADFGKPIGVEKDALAAEAWLAALCAESPVVKASFLALSSFYEQYRAWSEPFPGITGGDTFRLCFRLDPPDTASAPDQIFAPKLHKRDWSLRYFLQATDDLSLLVPAETVWREHGSTLKYLNRKFDAPQERLLGGLGLASRMFPPIETSLRAARPAECTLNVEQAYGFMRETSLLLESAGFGVLVPNVSRKLGVHVNVRSSQQPKGGVGGLSAESVFAYDWQLALGDEALSLEEFEKLVSLKVPLVQVRGQWVELQPDQIAQAIQFWEKQREGEATLSEALHLALATETANPIGGLPITSVAVEGWLNDLLRQLAGGAKMEVVPTPGGFHGLLRPYQSVGLAWLAFLRRWGLGACLADDMGLGKTIQIIALLLHERLNTEEPRPALLICPTSVVGNWQRELARFAPDLGVLVHHGAARDKAAFGKRAAQHDVVISSYALLHRDAKLFDTVRWGDVVLDEAQNIKNPSTKQAQAARSLQADWRAALTGTPVENRLTELWSIFQFLNPGFLGSQQEFLDRLARPIERGGDEAATRKLKSLVGPFILRRVKTDPAVISDLPDKNEMKVYCPLTREQATLYQAVVHDSLLKIQEAEGIDRRGVILGTLLKLKQVCNHPAQFLGDGSALAERSGKLTRLAEMLEETRAVRDHVLVFTQFAEMGQLLKSYLQDTFGEEVFFLHGGTPARTRTKMVETFQTDLHSPLIFVLSIKAGGTGLNLTRANHVFHFDRWWNPAVENQATDRAFRIGQTRNVQVHKFLCAGTFEEKIDELIERKKALAESIVGAGEAWLTELSTEQLKDLFTLRKEAVGD
jgi:SNF2 family DNA or RNA helicase